ncbi:MAG: alpha/beta hydrolase [Pseudomonadota bacterium]
MRKVFPLLLLLLSFSLHAEEHQLNHNGLIINANLEAASDNWKNGTVVLMTHGTLAHNRMEIMATLQEMFKDRGISSLAINLSLGLSKRTGMYDCAVPHTHKHTDALDEIGLWLGWLKQQGVKSVVLLGHSRGGNQTAWFAAERDDAAITKVVLVAPQVWSEEKNSKGYQKSYNKPLAPVLAKAKKLVDAGKGDTMLKPVDFIYCPQSSASASAFVAYYQPDMRMNTPSLLKQISKPVLVFAGSEDTVVKGLEEKMATPSERNNISFEVIDGADHFFLDLYAEELADMAEEFITGE